MREWLVVGMLGLVACIDSSLVPCGELACPTDSVCTPGGCALPPDVAACNGMADGATCMSTRGDLGVCSGGSCRTGLCGNGKLDPGEACDDGNQVSGDGCRGDCKKIEVCGDGIVDDGEQCDDGNTNNADGCDMCLLTAWQASTLVGAEVIGTSVGLGGIVDVAGDALGRTYFADGNRIRRVELDGSLTTIAGTGISGVSGDGGPAGNAELALPQGIAVDGLGRLYIADTNASVVRRVDVDNVISTIAGGGIGGDGGLATAAQLRAPTDVAVDALARVVIAESFTHRLRRIELDGTISTIAGTGVAGFSGDGGLATAAQLNDPSYLAIDAQGNVYVVERGNARIRRITPNGIISTIAGNGVNAATADGVLATAASIAPVGIAIDSAGRVIFGDNSTFRVRRIETDGTLTSIAGTTNGFTGDGGPASVAKLGPLFGVTVDGLGRVSITDVGNGRIRRIAANGTISTIAGNGMHNAPPVGASAASVLLGAATDVAFDEVGRILMVDRSKEHVFRVELDGSLVTLAGNGSLGYGLDNVLATTQAMTNPISVGVDAQHRVLVVDGCRIRAIDGSGTITTIAGAYATCGFAGDGGPATSALLQNVTAIATEPAGGLYIADAPNQRVRMVSATGTITTIAGSGATGSTADGVAATAALLGNPQGVAVDSQGRVLIADTGQHKIRRVELNGTITTVAGTGTAGFSGDGAAATSAQLSAPFHVIVDAMDRIYIADTGNVRVREIDAGGTIATVAGSGSIGFAGDGGPATAAKFTTIKGIAVDASGRLAIADDVNNYVRVTATTGIVTTIAGKIDPDNAGPTATARLADPRQLVVTPSFTLSAGGSSGVVELVANNSVTGAIGRYPQGAANGNLARFRTGTFGTVGGIAFDPANGLVYLTETGMDRIDVVTLVDPADPNTWTIAVLANTINVEGGTDGAAATATFRSPNGLYLDTTAHVLYIADTGNHAIRALDLVASTVTTVVDAQHRFGFGGDAGDAAAALLYQPSAVTRCPNGDFFIADTGNNRVRRIDATNTITTVIGDGTPASSGEGTPASAFPVDGPRGLACDAIGNLFVSSTTGVRLLPAAADGTVNGDGAVSTIYGAPPRSKFPDSNSTCLSAIAVTGTNTVEVADSCSGLLVLLTRVRQ